MKSRLVIRLALISSTAAALSTLAGLTTTVTAAGAAAGSVQLNVEAIAADKTATLDEIRKLIESDLDTFAGISNDGLDKVIINVGSNAPQNLNLDRVHQQAAAAGLAVEVIRRPYSLRELRRTLDEVSRHKMFQAANMEGFRYGINTDTNSVEVGVVAPASDLAAKVKKVFGDKVSVVPSERLFRTSGRFNDSPAFYGGIRLGVPNAGACTSGFTLTNLYGTRYAMTAGHCWALNTQVSASRQNGTRYREFGTVNFRRFSHNSLDVALIGGVSYAGRMWAHNNLADDSSYSLPVHEARDSCTGCGVIFNGSVTGIGVATLVGQQYCGNIGGVTTCGMQDATSNNGGRICQGGDSGGPVFAHNGRGGVIAVGIITASNQAGTRCTYTSVPRILSHWQSTITTG